MTERLGREHVLQIGDDELCCLGDMEIDESPVVAELNTRCSSHVKVKPSIKSQKISGTVFWDTANAAFIALKAAAINGTVIQITMVCAEWNGSSRTADETMTGMYYVTSWRRSEPVDDFVVVNFELRPAVNNPDPQYS
jgi:hypothetical protein